MFKSKFRNNFPTSNLNATFLPPPATEALSSDQSPLPTPTKFDVPDCSVDRDATPSSYNGPINENDLVVAVMGLTGAGKSSFINKATGNTEVRVGNDLTSQTRTVQPVRCTRPDGLRNIVLVDTPGFDDTHLSDAKILRTIASWLKETYQNNVKLAGILYLHRISDVRMAGTPLRNLTIFKDLCGDDNLKNIVLVTTMWDEVESQSIGSRREKELVSGFWKDMICLGSRTCRYQGTRESAWEIINHLDLEGSLQRRTPLQIQREMVDHGLPLHETTAAKTLLGSLGKEFKKVWAKIRGRGRQQISPGRLPGGAARARNGSLGTPRNNHENHSTFYSTRGSLPTPPLQTPLNSARPSARPLSPPPPSLRKTILRQSSTRSSSSEASRSVNSLTDTLSSTSGVSTRPSSIADSTTSGCSAIGRQEALSVVINGLNIVLQEAEIAPVPILREAIETVLCIAKLIEEMNGTHHAISQVVENSGCLLEEVTRYAIKSQLSGDMEKALSSFRRELKRLQNVVKKRGPTARSLLHDADIQVVVACNTSIKTIYEKLGLKLAMDNYLAIAHLQDELVLLRDNRECRECQCGSWVVREGNEENFETASKFSVS